MAKRKHKLSEEGRQKIREAQKRRWANYKAQKANPSNFGGVKDLQKQAEVPGVEQVNG